MLFISLRHGGGRVGEEGKVVWRRGREREREKGKRWYVFKIVPGLY